MENILTGMRRQAEREGEKEITESLPKAKTRKYDEAYVALGFTVTTVGDEERPVCLLFILLYVNNDTVLCRGVLITIL